MQKEIYEVKRERFLLGDGHRYLIQGMLPKGSVVTGTLGGREVPVEKKIWENKSAFERFADLDGVKGEKVSVFVTLPEDDACRGKLLIRASGPDGMFTWFSLSASELTRRSRTIQYYIEEERVDGESGSFVLRGWAASKETVRISVEDESGRQIDTPVQRQKRPDVSEMFKEADVGAQTGFFVELNPTGKAWLYLVFEAGEEKVRYKVDIAKGRVLFKKIGRLYGKALNYYRSYGFMALMKKTTKKIDEKKRGPVEYMKWLPKHLPSEEELELQRKHRFAGEVLFSIVVPLYQTPENYLFELIDSVKAQTYAGWELCLSDGSGKEMPYLDKLRRMAQEDKRIKILVSKERLDISANTNAALSMATGDYIVFADHDDTLTRDALYECRMAIEKDGAIDVLYSDEDKMTMDGKKFFQPHFKPDLNMDLLRTVNYFCHLFVIKRSLQERIGALDAAYDGAQDYDFVLRAIERAEHVHHIARILYHWRCHEGSTSENPESKLYAFEAGMRAVQAHYDRLGIPAEVEKGEYLGLYRTRYHWENQPLVSIIIPNKDHIEDLKRCMSAIEDKTKYPNYEYIIVENNSEEPETFDYYKQLETFNSRAHVVYYKGKFNYSKINNFGVAAAKGEYVWLLNNDTEMINADGIEELLGYCMRDDVGIVGARLYYGDDTVQHAGVVVGFGGIAGHCFVQQPRSSTGYFHRIISAQDYSAVTAACMMIKRSVFEAVGGLTEELEVAFNDIDFCMKVRSTGKLIVYNPYAEFYHYESKSRGLEDTPEKIQRFQKEIAIFAKRWPEILKNGDPYYNPNLTLESQDFSLKRL